MLSLLVFNIMFLQVVELRLYKAALSSPEDKSNSSDAVTVRENTSEETSPEKDVLDAESCVLEPNHLATGHSEMNNSFADSGHFEDCTNSSVHSKDSILFDDGNRSVSSYLLFIIFCDLCGSF